jgi:uncharacterized protein (DUF1697 family)
VLEYQQHFGVILVAIVAVILSLLRAVNVGGHNKVRMADLVALYESLNLEAPQTFLQSGNVLFRSSARDMEGLAQRIEAGLKRRLGIRTEVMLRTRAELRGVMEENPFAARRGLEPSKLLVYFLTRAPSAAARATFAGMKFSPEELMLRGRELYIYFPNGVGRSKLPWRALEAALGALSTGRNWNSVTRMLALAEEMESSR